MRLREALARCDARGEALLATNFYNAETCLAVLRAAKARGRDLILQASPSTIAYLGLDVCVALARAATRQEGARAWLHLDHATDRALVSRAIAAGFDSVMIDAGERPFAENVATTADVVAEARAAGVVVEAELGYVPKLGQRDDASGFTDPAQAAEFVRATGVDLLAVAIGNVHGFYRGEPRLDLARLAAIRAITPAPLVLHGGSGLPAQAWRDAVSRGVRKVNLATEIKDAFMRALGASLAGSDEIDLRKAFPPAMAAAGDLVAAKLDILATPEAVHGNQALG